MPAPPDLSARLRAMEPDQLAGLLVRVPVLRDALEGHGPLADVSAYGHRYPASLRTPHRSVERLARLLSGPLGIDACLAALDRTARDLVTLAVWHGGTLTRERALAAAAAAGADPEATGPRLDAAAAELAAVLLTHPGAGWVALRAEVGQVAGLPGVRARPSLELMRTDALQQVLRNHGVAPVPARKLDAVGALEAVLRDGDAVQAAAARLSGDARRVLARLAADGPQTVRDLGLPYYQPWDRTLTPLRELEAFCLAGVDYGAQQCWVWLDVVVALGGGVVTDWPSPPAAAPVAVRDPGGLPEVLSHLASLLALWRADPAPALAGGGIGVRPVRAAAKQLGLPAEAVGLLTSLAVALGLLHHVQVGTTGRGRAAKPALGWAPTALAEDFAARPADERWALLVQTWHDAEELDETAGLPERLELAEWSGAPLARRALLDLLTALPPGTGLDADDLEAVAAHRHPALLHPPVAGHLTAALRTLGLVPPEGPIGVTALGRALLDGPAVLAAALPPPATTVVVQADLSVVAPPDLAPDIGARLARYADLESAAGARLYRLSDSRMAAALDAGERDEDIIGFLEAHSATPLPLPQNVTYLVRDVARRHGRVRTGACAAYVRSDDAALLSRALGVKAAKLRALAPTVAISTLPPDKVLAALRAKGLMPVTEDADGLVLRPATTAPAPTGADLPTLRPQVTTTAGQAQRLAADLLATPPPPDPRRGRAPADPTLLDPWGDDDGTEEWVDVDRALLTEGRAAIQSLLAESRRRAGES